MASPRRAEIDGALAKYRAAAEAARLSMGVAAPPPSAELQPSASGRPPSGSSRAARAAAAPARAPPQPSPRASHEGTGSSARPQRSLAAAPAKLDPRLAALEQLCDAERAERLQLAQRLREHERKADEAEESIEELVELASELHSRQADQNKRIAQIESGGARVSASAAPPAGLAEALAGLRAEMEAQLEQRLAAQRDELGAQLERKVSELGRQQESSLVEERAVYTELLADEMQRVEDAQAHALAAVAGHDPAAGADLESRMGQCEQIMRGVTQQLLSIQSELEAMQAGSGLAADVRRPPSPASTPAAAAPADVAKVAEHKDAERVAQRSAVPARRAVESLQTNVEEEEDLLQRDIEFGAATVIQTAWRGVSARKAHPRPVAKGRTRQGGVARGDGASAEPRAPRLHRADSLQLQYDAQDRRLSHASDDGSYAGESSPAGAATVTDAQARALQDYLANGGDGLGEDSLDASSASGLGLALAMAQGGAAARSPPVPYGDEHKALELQRAFEAASADAPASPGWPAGPTGMVAALAQAALEGGGTDEDAESEDSALYDPPPGPPHVPAALLNQAEPPVAQWEEMVYRNASLIDCMVWPAKRGLH